MTARGRDPDDNRCDICHRRYRTNRAIMDCEATHRDAERRMREAGVTLKDTREIGRAVEDAAAVGVTSERKAAESIGEAAPMVGSSAAGDEVRTG